MSKALATVNFDYSLVDGDTKGKLIRLAGQARHSAGKSVAAMIEMGKSLADGQELLAKHGTGTFQAWAKLEVGTSKSSAYRAIALYERSVDHPNLGQMELSAAQVLAAPEAPEKALKEACKAVDKGEKVDLERANAYLKKFRETIKRTAGGRSSTAPASSGIPAAPGSQSNSASSTTPAASGEPAGGGLDPQDDEPIKDLSFEEQVKQENGKIESFCRGLVKFFEDGCPRLGSVDHMGRYDSALAQVRAACSTLRTCKYQEAPCPKCKGNGCSTCEKESDFGAVSVLTYRQIAG